jgi:hypothetical protein
MSLALMEWLRAGDGVHLFSTRRNELSNDEVFQEVDKIISRYWIWDYPGLPSAIFILLVCSLILLLVREIRFELRRDLF